MKKLIFLLSLFFITGYLKATIHPIGSGGSFSATTAYPQGDSIGINAGTYTSSSCTIANQRNITIVPLGNVIFTGGFLLTYQTDTNLTMTNNGAYVFDFSSCPGDGIYVYGAGNQGLFFNRILATNSFTTGAGFIDASSPDGDYVYYSGTTSSLKLYIGAVTNSNFSGCGFIFQGDYTAPTNLRNFVDSLVISNDTVTNTFTNGQDIGGNITRLYVHNNLITFAGLNTGNDDVGFAYFNGWGNFYDNIMAGGRGYLARDFLYSLATNPSQTAQMYNNLKHNTIKYGMFDVRCDATAWSAPYCTNGNFHIFNNTIVNCQDSDFIAPVVVVYQMDAGAVGRVDNNFGANLQFSSGGTFVTSFSSWVVDTASNVYTQTGALSYLKDTTTTFMPTATSYLNTNGVSEPKATPDLYGYTGAGNRIGAIYYNPGGSNTPPSFGHGTKSTIQLPLDSIRIGNVATPGTCRISTYAWSQVSGPSTATIVTPALDSSWFKNLVVGTYILQLKVEDTCSLAATVNDTIIVKAANTNPAFGQGSNSTIQLPLDSIRIGNVATPGGCRISTYAWTQLSGPSTATIVTPAADSSWFKNLVVGTYIVQLKATDTCGLFSTVSDTIVVHVANTPPSFGQGSNTTIRLPQDSLRIGNVATAGSCRISTYLWTQLSGPTTVTIVTPAADSSWIKNMVTGTYILQLKATDTCGNYATVKDTIVVDPTNTPPSFGAGTKTAITLPLDSTRIGNVATAGTCRISGYAWTQVSGPSTATIVTPAADSSWFKNLIAGEYILQLKATDTCGNYATVHDTIIVSSSTTPPTFGHGSNSTIATPLDSIRIGNVATAGTCRIESYSWSQLLGPSTATIVTPTADSSWFKNLVTGTYVFELQVTDTCGQNAMVKDTVNVTTDDTVTNVRNNTTLRLWPNPAYSILYESITGNINGNVVIKIFNTMGKIDIIKQFWKFNNVFETSFNVASLAPGTYYVQTNIAGGRVLITQTFLIQR